MLASILLSLAGKTGLSQFVIKTLAVGLLLLALIAVGAIAYHHVWKNGYTAAINAVAAKDKEAVDAAAQARDRRAACVNAGRVWDVTTGQCSGR